MPALRSWLLLAQLQTQTEALAARGRMPSLADRRAISEAECRTCLETGHVGVKYDQGLDTYRVPMALHALNRARLCDRMKDRKGVVLLQGGDQQTRYDTDTYIFLARPSLSWGAGEGHAHADGRSGQDCCIR